MLRSRRVPAPVAGTGRQEWVLAAPWPSAVTSLCVGHGGGGIRCSQVVRLLSLAGVTQ